MDLKGAKIRDVYKLCADINKEDEKQLRVNIPHYQRPFKWGEEKIELLIEDFFENYNNAVQAGDYDNLNEDKSYFAGSIVTVKKEDSNENHDLIDGQQRITTVFLTNYVKFLLLRSYIYQLIYKKHPMISEALNDMVKAGGNLYKSGYRDLKNLKKKVIKRIEKASLENNDEEYNNILAEYQKDLYMPLRNLDESDYNNAYKKKLNNFLSDEDLCLKYSRDSFNQKLKESLSSVKMELTSGTGPELEIINREECKQDNTIMQYINAIESIFNSFNVNDQALPPLEKADKMLDKINNFLNHLNFCVVQTGNTNDAYTLFEVLNDRALELDDLDLIKNMFYKEYCQKNRSEDEEVIDKNIEELEKLWGDEIFSRNTSDWKKKLVSYLGTVFLTGDTRAKHNQKAKYRKIIKNYLSEEYSNKNYTFKNIKYEFEIFQAIKLIINNYNIPYQKKGDASLEAENNISYSITYKTCHLLNALKYFGVMSALINIILKTYIKDNKYEFDKEKFKNFIEDVKNDKNNNDDRFKKIHECAHKLWKLTMLSKNYSIPRTFAKDIIVEINYREFNNDCLKMDIDLFNKAKNEFNEWVNRWYKDSKNDFRIKLLFLKLLQSKKENNKIIYKLNKNIFKDVTNLELDHFEPSDPVDDDIDKYFIPGGMPGKRSNYINQLGNFMLLEKKENISLSNKPADKSFKYYKKIGLGIDDHWLVKELDDLLEKYNNKKTNMDIRIPNENFFNERKRRLKNYFYTLVSMGLQENEKEIEKIKV